MGPVVARMGPEYKAVKRIGGGWRDAYDNVVTDAFVAAKAAEYDYAAPGMVASALLTTLKACRDCWDCWNCSCCTGCDNCSECHSSDNCTHCVGLFKCARCRDCQSCWDCSDSTSCQFCAHLNGAYKTPARLRDMRFASADASDGTLHTLDLDMIPHVSGIHRQVYDAVNDGGICMTSWHKCATVHCRAGWVTHITGLTGIEDTFTPVIVAMAVYHASYPTIPVYPWQFFVSEGEALADIKRCYLEEQKITETQ